MRLTFKSGDLAPRGSPSLKWVGLIQPLENRKRIMTWLPWARGNLASWLPLHSNQHITGAPTCTCWTSQTSVITRAAWNLSSPSRFFFSLSLSAVKALFSFTQPKSPAAFLSYRDLPNSARCPWRDTHLGLWAMSSIYKQLDQATWRVSVTFLLGRWQMGDATQLSSQVYSRTWRLPPKRAMKRCKPNWQVLGSKPWGTVRTWNHAGLVNTGPILSVICSISSWFLTPHPQGHYFSSGGLFNSILPLHCLSSSPYSSRHRVSF